MFIYKRSNHLKVVGHSDSDFARYMDSIETTFGYLFLFVRGAISWKSGKEPIIAISTLEAKFVACFDATSQALWLKNCISSLTIVDNINRSLKIYCDNFVAVFLSKNDKYSKSIKHIDIKYLYVKEEVLKQKVLIEHTNTSGGSLTKGLPSKIFVGHIEHMVLIGKPLLA